MKRIKKKISNTARDRYLRVTYGITLEDYDAKFKEQKGQCAICGQKSAKSLNVDHIHKRVGSKDPSGGCTADKVRGLLCNFCNRMILGAIERRGAVSPRKIIENLFSYATKYLLRGEK